MVFLFWNNPSIIYYCTLPRYSSFFHKVVFKLDTNIFGNTCVICSFAQREITVTNENNSIDL